MKTNFFTAVLIICFVFGSVWDASSQVIEKCGTVTKTNEWLEAHPELINHYAKIEHELDVKAKADAANPNTLATTVYVVPVVFHIIHENGPENVPDATIHASMRILNEDYRSWNWDTILVAQAFQPIIGKAFIEFRLAQLDPSGNPTTGIDRIVSSETNIGDNSSKLNYWPRSKYLNIWICKVSSAGAAYAYLPGGAPTESWDGILANYTYIGEGKRTLTHEVGHWINLRHTWGPTNIPGLSTNCSTDDGVLDTPNTEGVDNNSCDTAAATCSSLDNIQNHMDYSTCEHMFTEGQVSIMRSALTSTTAARNNLWKVNNLISTGVYDGAIDFKADFTTVCAGSQILFTDLSYNGITEWEWSLPGATPDSAFGHSPVVTYDVLGTYDATVRISNDTGSAILTKTNYITVMTALTMPYSQDFATSGDWALSASLGASDWTYSNVSFSGSGGSMMLDNFNNGAIGDVSVGVGPIIDMNVMQSATLTFEAAYAKRTTATDESLIVYVSGDCGESWSLMIGATSPSLAGTNGVQSSAFTPADSNDWKWFSGTIPVNLLSENFRFKFEFTSDAGNNVYIDNINITGTFNAVPFLIFPGNFSLDNNVSLILDWDAIANVTTYEYQIDTTEAFNSPFLITGSNIYLGTADNLSDTEYQLSGLDSGWTVYWKVRTVAPAGTSGWSATWRFKIANFLAGVQEKLSGDLSIQAYPNPTNDIVTIALKLLVPAEKLTIEVFDILGRRSDTHTKHVYESLNVGRYEFKIEHFGEPGIYTIRINIDGDNYFTKIISIK